MSKIKHNLFAKNGAVVEDTISHSELNAIVREWADGAGADKLSDTFIQHGITNVEVLFPEPKRVGEIETVDNETSWCAKVNGGVKHVDFEKTRSDHFDITGEEARALGYINDHFKKEEQIAIMKRSTEATWIYKKQSISRGLEIEMDFDLIAYYRKEMREKLAQESARAILVGDGRPEMIGDEINEDKIDENCIRPIWKDVEFYSVHKDIPGVTTSSTDAQIANAFIDMCTMAMSEWEGSGTPTIYVNPRIITACLMLKDNNGRRIYKTMEELKAAMDINAIVKVDLFKNHLIRTNADGSQKELAAIIVNLKDYVVGQKAKGKPTMFDDFDLHYNKKYFLVETRFSGALTHYHSAVCLELPVGDNDVVPNFTVTPIAGTETKYGKLVSALQDGVRVTDKGVVGKSKWVTGYSAAFPDNPNGNFLALHCDCLDDATTTVELVGGKNGPATFTSDDKDVVVQIEDNKKQFLRFVSTSTSGKKIVKDYTLMGLTLENPPRS